MRGGQRREIQYNNDIELAAADGVNGSIHNPGLLVRADPLCAFGKTA
jgi:hypothetical protein